MNSRASGRIPRIGILSPATEPGMRDWWKELTQDFTFCTHMLFCAKNIERIGDHATNIAETVYYIVEGRSLPSERPKADITTRGVPPQSP